MSIFYSASTGGFYDNNIHEDIPNDSIELNKNTYEKLLRGQSNGRKIVPGSNGFPTLESQDLGTLEELKKTTISKLWNAFKTYQRDRVDPEDLTLAASCAAGGSSKGVAVQGWVLNLWAKYYEIKTAISNCEDKETLSIIKIDPSVCGELPCSIAELNEEAYEVYK